MNPKTLAALAAFRRGLAVYASQPNKKHNHKGHRTPFKDEASLIKYYEAHPNDNIKALIQRGYLCLDFDAKYGGFDLFLSLANENKLPETYNEDTPSNGVHVWYRIPEDIKTKSILTLKQFAGLEFKAENNDATLAGSVVDGVEYVAMGDNPINDAPAWIVDLLRANEPQPYVYKAIEPARANEGITARERAWADSAIRYIARDLAQASEGKRFPALRKATLSLGNLCPHYFDLAEAEKVLLNVTAGWSEPKKVQETITHNLKVGMETPRRLDISKKDSYRSSARDDARFVKNVVTVIPFVGKYQTKEGGVQAVSVRAGALACANKVEEIGDYVFHMSERELSEAADMGTKTASKVLTALQNLNFIKPANEKSLKHAEEKDIPEGARARNWELTIKGFSALERRFDTDKTTSLRKSLNGKENIISTSSTSSFSLGLLSEVVLSVSEDDKSALIVGFREKLGVFKHGVIARNAEIVMLALATGGKTTRELIQMTGLIERTVIRLLNRLEAFGLIQRGGRENPHTLADDIGKQALAHAQAHETVIKRDAKAEKNDSASRAWQDKLREKRAERETERIDGEAEAKPVESNYGKDASKVMIED